MRKVELIRGSRVVLVDQRLAPLLQKKSGYLRRDMVAQAVAEETVNSTPAAPSRVAADIVVHSKPAAPTADVGSPAPKKDAKTKAKKAAVKKTAPAKDASE